MPIKRKTRDSNNTSINTSGNVSNSTGTNAAGNEDKDKKRKETPYYTWW